MQEAFHSLQQTVQQWNKRTNSEISVLLSDESILHIGNIINGMSQHLSQVQIKIPRLVVVGTQSSGKSSLLNRIIGADLLPTGNQIVTRTPLSLELSPGSTNQIEFGHYQEGHWLVDHTQEFKFPNPSEADRAMICERIRTETIQRAGSEMGVSDHPIWIRITAPSLPNLTLVDLPGLTMVACTDRGQPKNIKEQIRQMVRGYLTPTETIILAVMAARTDLETDLALDLVKEVDSEGQRTVGIITKLDLMGERAHVGHYLENEISRDLQLKHGYYGVVNSPDESQFLDSHGIYRQARYRERVGIANLSRSLTQILITQIRTYLPQILQQLREKLIQTREQLPQLGTGIPETPEGRSALIHQVYSNFVRRFISVLNDRGHSIPVARRIKDILIKYRTDLAQKDPFSVQNFPDEHLSTLIDNCEGNHMSFPVPPIEVLEQCLRDPKIRPLYQTMDLSLHCVEQISQELINLTQQLCDSRFQNLNKLFQNHITTRLIVDQIQITHLKLRELYGIEQSYIWTDDLSFLETMKRPQKSRSHLEQIRELVKVYYGSVVNNFQHNVPKMVVHFLIDGLMEKLQSSLYDLTVRQDTKTMLEESPDLAKRRERLGELQGNLEKLHDEIEKILN